MKKNGGSGLVKGSKGVQKKPKFVDTCSVASLWKIGEKVGYNTITGNLAKDGVIKRLLAPNLSKLLEMTLELMKKEPEKTTDVRQRLDGVKKEDTLIRPVHETFRSNDGNASHDEAPKEWRSIEKADNMCQVRGNWLSVMANVANQAKYLGQLHLIW